MFDGVWPRCVDESLSIGYEAKSEDPQEYELEVESPDHKRLILFTTKAGKVINVSTGMKPMVLHPEPCR